MKLALVIEKKDGSITVKTVSGVVETILLPEALYESIDVGDPIDLDDFMKI